MNRILLSAFALLPAVLLAQPGTAIYTTDADFALGALFNVNFNAPFNNQLQLTFPAETFPFINVAASGRGTVVRINTDTGSVVGEYKTAPVNRSLNPSRTTVDLLGNVWTGSRDEATGSKGSVTKIGVIVGGTRSNADGTPNALGDYLKPPFQYNTCVDRNGDGLIKTSRTLGHILTWSNPGGVDDNGGVSSAEDECILIYKRNSTPNTRHVSVDKDNNVWVAGYPFSPQVFEKLNGATGATLASFNATLVPDISDNIVRGGCGGYGGFIDKDGILWSATISQHRLLRYDTNLPVSPSSGRCIGVTLSYGLGVEPNGDVWNNMWTNNTITKLSPAGAIYGGFPKTTGAGGGRGVAVTPLDSNIWGANSNSNNVTRYFNTGTIRKHIPVGSTPTGVAVDNKGRVWVTNFDGNSVMRINPTGGGDGLGAVDLTISLGFFNNPGVGPANGNPYNYSDMTGTVALGSTSNQGLWDVIRDGGHVGKKWGAVRWNGEPQGAPGNQPAGTVITVEGRAAASLAALSSASYVPLTSGAQTGLIGQFLEVRATLVANPSQQSPILSDLSVTNLACQVDADNDIDIDDINLINAARNAGVSAGDPRDADGDLRVTVLDARLCATRCTKPNCAR
jgi:hypothetical protein